MNVIYHRLFAVLFLFLLPFSASASLSQVIDTMLAQADADLAEDRLTTPANQNAYDRYRAVLLLDKSNERAALGLRAIAQRYLEFSSTQLKRRNFPAARSLLNKAIEVGGRTSATAAQAKAIRVAAARKVQRPVVTNLPPPKPLDAKQTTFALNANDLGARNQRIMSELQALGQRVQNTKEYVLIYARNDAEGRWIYQQIRKASPGHRVRGNIKRNKKPRVILESPLN